MSNARRLMLTRVGCALMLATSGVVYAGCAGVPTGKEARRDRRDSWDAWRDLSPVIDVAAPFVGKDTRKVLSSSKKLLARGAAKTADEHLRAVAGGPDGLWISVIRANVLALNFTRCVRGIAWRLEDLEGGAPTTRVIDNDPATRLGPNDISVEATLSNLEQAVERSSSRALTLHARIARARVTTTVLTCPPNATVAELAQATAQQDLATLAAQEQLPPDLAYVWAQVQMSSYSAAAAKPFFLRALNGGFNGPTVEYMLSIVSLELREYEEAMRRAQAAAEIYAERGERGQAAQAWAVHGEACRRADQPAAATAAFERALGFDPIEPTAILGFARLEIAAGRDPQDTLGDRLRALYGEGPLTPDLAQTLVQTLEALAYIADEELALSQALRDSLIDEVDVDPDPARRALRYFFAATLDARLGDLTRAHGRAAVALAESEDADFELPVDIRALLDRLATAR